MAVFVQPEPLLYCHCPPGIFVVPVIKAVPEQITAVVGLALMTGEGLRVTVTCPVRVQPPKVTSTV